mmetsp:Transcript_28174/g.83441  ORF Transcript_28174/g.83441 Transcript_28174/m.83441 type:complete len:104 (-) Transcript_28174:202-513(-)
MGSNISRSAGSLQASVHSLWLGWQSAGSHGVEAEAELRSDCQAAHMSASAGHEVDTTHCSSVSQIPSSKQPASASWLLSRPAAAAGQSSWWPFNLRQVRQSYA